MSDEYFYGAVRFALNISIIDNISLSLVRSPHTAQSQSPNTKHQQLTPNSIQTANTGPTTPNSLFINLHL